MATFLLPPKHALQAVPRPVVMQLATREVQVSHDEEEGDDEDGETWLRASREAVGATSVALCSSTRCLLV